MHINALVSDTQHIPGTLNVIYDGLSRNKSPEELGLNSSLLYNAIHDQSIVEFITLCDPAHELTDHLSHVTLLHQCQQLLLT
jgi:hypothetical protein